jgi:adenylate kinase
MIVALTGTPGVGKSTVAKILRQRGYEVESVSELAEKLDCIIGEERGSRIVDINSLADKIEREGFRIIEGHLSHHLNPDIAVVLRCNPKILKKRLSRKGWAEEKILENLEAEITDVILMEAMDVKNIYEIDTSRMGAEEVANAVDRIINGDTDNFTPGKIDWIFDIGDEIGDLIRRFF